MRGRRSARWVRGRPWRSPAGRRTRGSDRRSSGSTRAPPDAGARRAAAPPPPRRRTPPSPRRSTVTTASPAGRRPPSRWVPSSTQIVEGRRRGARVPRAARDSTSGSRAPSSIHAARPRRRRRPCQRVHAEVPAGAGEVALALQHWPATPKKKKRSSKKGSTTAAVARQVELAAEAFDRAATTLNDATAKLMRAAERHAVGDVSHDGAPPDDRVRWYEEGRRAGRDGRSCTTRRPTRALRQHSCGRATAPTSFTGARGGARRRRARGAHADEPAPRAAYTPSRGRPRAAREARRRRRRPRRAARRRPSSRRCSATRGAPSTAEGAAVPRRARVRTLKVARGRRPTAGASPRCPAAPRGPPPRGDRLRGARRRWARGGGRGLDRDGSTGWTRGAARRRRCSGGCATRARAGRGRSSRWRRRAARAWTWPTSTASRARGVQRRGRRRRGEGARVGRRRASASRSSATRSRRSPASSCRGSPTRTRTRRCRASAARLAAAGDCVEGWRVPPTRDQDERRRR